MQKKLKAPIQKETNPTTAPILVKKIGSTTYKLNIHFSSTSKEHFNDKLIRLIKNDLANNVEAS